MTADKVYSHILVPLENTTVDATILGHVRRLARLCESRITLLHVADGFMARNQMRFAESPEMEKDRLYLEQIQAELTAEGFTAEAVLICGEPADQILAYAAKCECDLIAMATHGHRGLSDVILGSVAAKVRHRTCIPVLLLKARS